jgi:hypothetical protein
MVSRSHLVSAKAAKAIQRWSYASEATMSIPGRPIGYAIPPTTCRQSHPRRIPTDLLSTRNHLLASSIVPRRKSAANTEQITANLSNILQRHPCYRVLTLVNSSALSLGTACMQYIHIHTAIVHAGITPRLLMNGCLGEGQLVLNPVGTTLGSILSVLGLTREDLNGERRSRLASMVITTNIVDTKCIN